MIIGEINRFCKICNREKRHNVKVGGKIECIELHGDRRRQRSKYGRLEQIQLFRETVSS